MISRSNLGSGHALVYVAPNDNPNQGGGPIRRAPGSNVVYAHAGNYVSRTPHLVVREAEPGANWPDSLAETMMFLPDGRLVPQTSAVIDMFRGAGPEPMSVVYAKPFATGLRAFVPVIAMFTGGALGYKMSSKHPGWATLGGAVVGGILGRIFR